MSDFNVFAYPTNMIIDKKGIVRFIKIGAKIDDDNSQLIEALIDEIEKLKKQANH